MSSGYARQNIIEDARPGNARSGISRRYTRSASHAGIAGRARARTTCCSATSLRHNRRPAAADLAGPDPRVLREASLIYRSAAERGERLSQRTLARRLRNGGHRFSNQQLRRIAASIGPQPPPQQPSSHDR